MATPRFFYSVNGTEVGGPVAMDELHRLFQQGVLSTSSHFCIEGENEWHPLSPAVFAILSEPAPAGMSNPWIFLGGLGALVLATIGYLMMEADAPGPKKFDDGAAFLKITQDAKNGDAQARHILRDITSVTKPWGDDIQDALTQGRDPGDFMAASFSSPTDIDVHRAMLVELQQQQADILASMQNFDNACHQALAPENLSRAEENKIISSFHDASLDPLITFWQLNMKITGQRVELLDFLKKNWGQWTAVPGKPVTFKDEKLADTYHETLRQMADEKRQAMTALRLPNW